MKKNLKLIVFAIVLCAVSVLNVKVMLNTEHSSDLLMTSLSAISKGYSGDGESGSGGITWNCMTITTDVYNQTVDCQMCGYTHVASVWETKECNRGTFSFCYPGYTTTYYNCQGEVDSVSDMTSTSTCF